MGTLNEQFEVVRGAVAGLHRAQRYVFQSALNNVDAKARGDTPNEYPRDTFHFALR